MVNSSAQHPLDTDVIVIGGGPAGATASTLIAQQGYRVELFERARSSPGITSASRSVPRPIGCRSG